MRTHLPLLLLIGTLACGRGEPIANAQSPTIPSGPETPSALAEVIDAHNQERARAGLSPLPLNAHLTAAATAHAQDMAKHKQLSHTGSDGSTLRQRIERQGYVALQVAENIAAGPRTVPEVMRTWLDSPLHRQNILGPFADIGVARSQDEAGVLYWCVVFGKPQ